MVPASQRYVLMVILGSMFLGFGFVNFFRGLSQGTRHPDYTSSQESVKANELAQHYGTKDGAASSSPVLGQDTLLGGAIAPHLGNGTVKAELGRASWKYFHTVFAQFPDHPSTDEQLALSSWVYLFARLYPCGECATHFQAILSKFPPQVVTRSTAAAWGCHVHNEVNKSLGKEVFDCSRIGDFYDCGCSKDGEEEA